MIEIAEQRLQVRRIFRNGRRRYDPALKARLVAACFEPDVSVSLVALEHGVNANLLKKWIKQAREVIPEQPSPASKFIPVVAADHRRAMQSMSTSLAATRGEALLTQSERTGPRFLSAR